MANFHARMMNIQGRPASMIAGSVQSWNEGHRDARHEAALIALEADARIEALERQVKAADALVDILTAAMHEHDTANYEYGEENPWTMQEWFSDEDRAALAAYKAAKEGGA